MAALRRYSASGCRPRPAAVEKEYTADGEAKSLHGVRVLRLPLVLLAVACLDARDTASQALMERAALVETDSSFAQLIERLSEPSGYFDTDNLISNETSYLHVLDKLRELWVSGGAYIGVGPDQNFSYIAAIRPSIAFIIDIRRDNLLQHLMFKSIFELAENRLEYLCLLLGRRPPADAAAWTDRSIGELIEYVEAVEPNPDEAELVQAAVAAAVVRFGIPLSEADLATIRRFHSTFIREDLNLRFTSHGRRPRPYYPTYRQLLLETDLSGRQASYLADEGSYRFLKSLQERDLVVPVVGDFAGDHALVSIGDLLSERGIQVSAFYTSNVEFYLMRAGSFGRYAENLQRLPRDEKSVIIRSFFGRNFGYLHPEAVPGYYSVQLLQTIESLVAAQADGGYRSYLDLVTRDVLQLR